MPDVLCPHGDLLDACIDCTVAPPAPKAQPPVAGRFIFWASFPGECPECTVPIEPGMQIAACTDDRYRHRGCVDRWEAPDA